MNSLESMFPDRSREHRILQSKSAWWVFKNWIKKYATMAVHLALVVFGFVVAAIVILLLMGALKALGVKSLE